MVTPFIDSLKVQGGTLYTFSSAAKDLTRVFADNRYSFTFSHFACLNLPDVKDGVYKRGENMKKGMYLSTLLNQKTFEEKHPEHSMFYGDSVGLNLALAENFQNYVLNFETTILEGMGDNDDYDPNELLTVSERVFFNWLTKIGAIDFENYNGTDFIENESDFSNRVVQYIGNIDVINSVDVYGDAYDEVYVHIPSGVGGSTDVKFRTTRKNSSNYVEDKIYKCENKFIVGREEYSENLSPYGLSIDAIYDIPANYEYKSDQGFYIDFREESYTNGIMGMNMNSTEDFEFNCVLLYYTLKNNANGEMYSNLYGVLFLEEITPINNLNEEKNISRGYIQRYPKIAGQNNNGNSYALKIDLKIDSLPDTTFIPKEYDDVNDDYAGALEIYSQSLLQIQHLANKILEEQKELGSIKDRILELEELYQLGSRVKTVEDMVNYLNSIVEYKDTVYNGVSLNAFCLDNARKINALINGETNANIVIDTNIISSGYGINVIKEQETNKIKIESKNSTYNIGYFYKDEDLTLTNVVNSEQPIKLNTLNGSTSLIKLYTSLDVCSNLILLYTDEECNSNLELYIGTEITKWVTGQSFKIKFMYDDFDVQDTIWTKSEKPNITINTSEDMQILKDDIPNNLDYIEIICIDQSAVEPKKKFIYEIKTK